MSRLKKIDLGVLKRAEFETKRSYDNAVWFVEHLNDLVMLYNNGYVLFNGNRQMVPELSVKIFGSDDDLWLSDNGIDINKTGELHTICIEGSCMLIGHTRDCIKGRIYVSKKEAKDFLKGIKVVRKSDIHNFLDL